MMRAAWRAGDCAELSTWAQGAKDQELAPECWLLGVSVATRYPGGPHLVSLSPYYLYYLQIATPAPPLTASWRHVGRGVCRGGVHVSTVITGILSIPRNFTLYEDNDFVVT